MDTNLVITRVLHTIFAALTLKVSMRIVAFLALLLSSVLSTFAIVDPPKLYRACLNGSDSTVSLEWTEPNDACNSFTEYHIYGRENSGSYSLLRVVKNLATTNIQFKLPSAAFTWNFYIQTLNTCNGTDSVTSNNLKVDKVAPLVQDIDSVSIDLLTQKIVIGWQKNPAPDTKWYRIYEKQGTAKRLGDTTALEYVLKQHSATTPISISIAAFDSCDQPAPISTPHQPIILSHLVDTCTRTITLTWTSYVGWGQVDRYELLFSKNGAPYVSGGATSALSFAFKNFVLGDQLCFVVRAVKKSTTRITSSSNRICSSTRKPIPPAVTYLSAVTVNGEDLDIVWLNSGSSDLASFELLKNSGSGDVVVHSTGSANPSYSYTDSDVDVNNINYLYTVRALDFCGKELKLSNQSKNILLALNGETLSWNPYVGWQGNVREYVLESFDGSTWNIFATTSGNSHKLDTSYFSTSICIRVRAEEENNPVFNSLSVSNVVCTEGRFVFYIPNALNPQNSENYFKVVGTNIDYDKSGGLLFSRWGETLLELNNLDVGWDGRFKGEPLPLGLYYYKIVVYSRNGHKSEANGYVRIIR
jgi:gliding motility-associated-like protein